MSATKQQGRDSQSQQSSSAAEQRVREYLLDSENISYSLRFRPVGIVHWLKALVGYGVTYWFVTNQRVIQETEISGGFAFKDVSLDKISSIEYGTRVSLLTVALGILLVLGGIGGFIVTQEAATLIISLVGLGLIWYAYYRRRQVLRIQASGGASIALNFSKGEQVDDILWYLHAERHKKKS